MDIERLEQSEDLKNDGVWCRWDRDGAMVKLRHTFSKRYTQARQEAERKLRRQKAYRPDKLLTTEEELEITRESVAKGLIVDWRGFTNGGAAYEFNEEHALTLCGLSSFLMKCVSMATDDSNFELENLEVLEGNS